MTLLIDTHAFIWWDSDPNMLSPKARAAIEDGSNTVLLSTASIWEL